MIQTSFFPNPVLFQLRNNLFKQKLKILKYILKLQKERGGIVCRVSDC